MTYGASVEWLYRQQWHGIHLGLEKIRRLVAALDIPLAGAGAPRFVHVAGTNGKGSVCAMIEAMLRARGLRTGLFISPHLVSFRERIRVGGETISEAAAAAGLSAIRSAAEGWEDPPTFFEITTALALVHFQQQAIEVAVLETGLGGRLDATNVVTPLVSVVAPIDLDHQQWLGPTLVDIAREKAGIIKPGIPVVSAPQAPEVLALLREVAAREHAPFHLVEQPLAEVALSLAGSHQRWNAALAVRALEVAQLPVSLPALAQVEWPGRFQRVGDKLVLDGAHNPAAAQRLALTWQETFGREKASLILGVMKDKDYRAVCAALAPLAVRVWAVPVQNDRALLAEEIAAVFAEIDPALECHAAPSSSEAIEQARRKPERLLVAGSLFLVGEVLRTLQGGGDGIASAQ